MPESKLLDVVLFFGSRRREGPNDLHTAVISSNPTSRILRKDDQTSASSRPWGDSTDTRPPSKSARYMRLWCESLTMGTMRNVLPGALRDWEVDREGGEGIRGKTYTYALANGEAGGRKVVGGMGEERERETGIARATRAVNCSTSLGN